MIMQEGPWLEKGDMLICLGDSLTANPTGYVRILTELLAPRGVKVINAGRGGSKTPTALTFLQADVIDRKPTAVSIFLGANDAAVGRGEWADEPRVPPEVYGYNLRWIVHICRLSGIKKFSITPPLFRYEGDAYGRFGDVMRDYCLAAREAADDMRARFVPADVAFSEEWARHPGHTGFLLTVEGTHLTDAGNKILASTMIRTWGCDWKRLAKSATNRRPV